MSTDTPFEQRLRDLYAVPVPAGLERRIATAMTTVPVQGSGRTRSRLFVALAVAAILAVAAAGPALEWFGGTDDPFERLWEVAVPVDRSVTADGYRVTVHRAYADRLGVRLAMTVEDLEDRWSGLEVDGAEMTDSRGRAYDAWNWSRTRRPVDGAIAQWARFLLPDEIEGDDQTDDLKLRVTVTSLWVRSPEPLPIDPDPEQIFASVGGEWSFEFDMPPIAQAQTISPVAEDNAEDVTIELVELGVVPSGTILRLAVEGLPELPAGSVQGWKPVSNIEHDGVTLDEFELDPGVVGPDGVVTIETLQVEDLAGHWRIKVLGFWSSSDPTLGQSPVSEGEWILEFDVPAAS